MTKTYEIPSQNLADLTKRFAQLGRRAKKLGLMPPSFKETGTKRVEQKDGITGFSKFSLVHLIEVDPGCGEIKVHGWTFVAVIQHTEEGNIVRNLGGVDLDKKYRDSNPVCEHCNKARNRKDTYVLRHENGDTKQVGRSCLIDFFGSDALQYAEAAQYVLDVEAASEFAEDGFGFGGSGKNYDALEVYLPFVAECIKLEGWMSRGRARMLEGMMATCDVAHKHAHPDLAPKKFKFLFDKPSAESVEMAEKAIEWAANLEGEEINEYLSNIRVIARRTVCEARDIGLAASIVAAYQNHLNRLRMQELRVRQAEVSKHVGNVGDKLRIKLTVDKVIQIDGTYGTSFLHSMTDAEGNSFKWFSSGEVFETGSEILVAGTVKKHDEYKGMKQTLLTRCAAITLRNFFVVFGDETFRCEALDSKEATKLFKETKGIARMPKGLKVIEDVTEAPLS